MQSKLSTDDLARALGRRCIGCMQVDSRENMWRLVLKDQQLTIDRGCKLGGRGAWLHPDPDCLKMAKKRRAFLRAFKGAAFEQPADLFSEIEGK
ncbi:hypothetical protein BK816_05960 [Boudabousia tangfeifanii]|uniref:YlxR domain-containing protein n=1 Tax=Boudabousia tangfeifanii TaxID=1912795 RepID=A0A1D9ML46_9ACTO|nr:YlxR family protein [Boudabousia tangfeifanii]AOZ72893.1 hypothetical protein BK816_05960 [Boudabousia tangfeifanii]